ncbi:MAG: diaminopimelate decarboxylase family protein [Candidatus Hodarchaeota archaeon]
MSFKAAKINDISFWGFQKDGNSFKIGSFKIHELADQYGSPLHILDESHLLRTCRTFRDTFQAAYPKTEIFYSYKTNSVPGILQLIHSIEIGAEVISPFELWLALKLNVPTKKIIYNGIIKPKEGLILAIENNIQSINIDSLTEIQEIEKIASSYGKKIKVGLRLCMPKGWNAQFGLTVENEVADLAIRKIMKSPHLEYKGLMIHAGTGSRNAKIYLYEIDYILEYAAKIKKEFNLLTEIIDIGGGFGVASVKNMSNKEAFLYRMFDRQPKCSNSDDFMPLTVIAEKISKKIKQKCSKLNLPLPILHLEPGRAITSNAQLMLLRIYEIKKRGKKTILVTDGGRYNCTFPLSFESHYIFIANKINQEPDTEYYVVGRLCSPGDWILRSVKLPSVEVGDILVIMDTGAYFSSFSNKFSFSPPAIISISNDKIRILRKRETHEDMISMDNFIF